MARPRKQTVDYFPHDCEGKKTLFTLENLYGNDGYAFWFKLLELLGQTEGHCYDTTKAADRLYLFSRARVSEDTGEKILKTLSDLEAICPVLYAEGKVWSQNFVDRLRGVYDKRNTKTPIKPSFRGENKVSGADNPQSKEKKTKAKGKETDNASFDARLFLSEKGVHPQLISDWLKCRKEKRLANTLTAFELVCVQASKAGLTIPEAIKASCERGWGGFRSSWLENEKNSRPQAEPIRIDTVAATKAMFERQKREAANA